MVLHYYLAIKANKVMKFGSKWIEVESSILSEVTLYNRDTKTGELSQEENFSTG